MTALLFVACAAATPVNGHAPGEVVPLRVQGATLRAHVADDPEEREQGLMGVTQLAPDEGMVFVYPSAGLRYFWMKDTPTALSIAFCDEAGKVLTLAEMAPLDTTLTPSVKPAMYVIEAKTGWFVDHGVRVGDTVVGLPAGSRR
jgi:hypothetical protein